MRMHELSVSCFFVTTFSSFLTGARFRASVAAMNWPPRGFWQ